MNGSPGGPSPTTRDTPAGAGAMTSGELTAVAAVGALVLVTVGWWALALWPAPADAPEWLLRTREVCFGRTDSGLPEVDGWMLLVGQPLGMLGLLLAGWRGALTRGMRKAWGARAGRLGLGVAAAGLVVGLAAVGVRVATATAEPAWARADVVDGAGADGGRQTVAPPPEDVPTVDRPAPRDRLVDQHGDTVGIGTFAGRPVLVTFAFGHCETVCPVVAHAVTEAKARLAPEIDAAILVLTLDPWRDTPSRLEWLHERWMLPPGARVLGGEVRAVEEALDAWEVARSRDRRTGDVVHPALVYLVDRSGVIRYGTTGGVETIVELARRMDAAPRSVAGR